MVATLKKNINILRKGHPILDSETILVDETTIAAVVEISKKMIDLMCEIKAVGIAANQIGVPLRFFVLQIPQTRAQGGEVVSPTVIINPRIEPINTKEVLQWEGCLSIPGITGYVPRWEEIMLYYTNINGNNIQKKISGFHARVVQHEVDHLHGYTYINKIKDFKFFGFKEEISQFNK